MKACRHFKGDRPCKYYWIDKSWDCFECEHYNPYNERILLINMYLISLSIDRILRLVLVSFSKYYLGKTEMLKMN